MISLFHKVTLGMIIGSFLSTAVYAHDHHKNTMSTEQITALTTLWKKSVPLQSTDQINQLSQKHIVIGQATDLALYSARSVQFPLRPEEPGGSVSFAGMVQFEVKKAGTYRVVLNNRAWIEMVHSAQNKAIESNKHQHGPDGSGIGKMIDFPLTIGIYTLEITGSKSKVVKVMITPAT